MNPQKIRDAKTLYSEIAKRQARFGRVEVVVAPPFPYISTAARTRKIHLAAQDVSWEVAGSYTGEVSCSMLKDLGITHVIVGHSERRRYLAESDEIVNKKLKAVLKANLHPIVCVGELKRDPDGLFFGDLRRQVEATFAKLKKQDLGKIVIAYEPVWAIGSGTAAHPEDAREAALFIKKTLADLYDIASIRRLRIIYGGSVNAKNATSFLKEQEIVGLLVGRESLNPKEFLGIIECARLIS